MVQQPESDDEATIETPRFEPVPLPDDEFKDQLAQVIPHLRAFGRSLSGSRDLADDLVQETLLKAWAARKRFQAGTNMRAWTFIILRNLFLSQMRRARFKGEWDEITASKLLAAPASQDRHVELGDMQRALLHLPQPQREALILVGAGGFAYEEAAEICGCAVGTIKSRVARGRVALEDLLTDGKLPSRREHETDGSRTALQSIMSEVDELSRDRDPRECSRIPTGEIGAVARLSQASRYDGFSRVCAEQSPRTSSSERTSPSIAKAWRRALPTPAWTVGGATFTNRLEEACTMASILGLSVFTCLRTRRERPEFQTLRALNVTDLGCCMNETQSERSG